MGAGYKTCTGSNIMQNLITVSGVKIRALNGLFSLNDLHRASGGKNKHKPSLWANNKQTIELKEEISKAGIPAIQSKQGLGTFVCKELVIHYGMWISPEFSLQVIRTFLDVRSGDKTTTDQRTPLRDAVNLLVGKKGLMYPEAYSVIHQRFNVKHIDELSADQVPMAIEYVHKLTLDIEWLPDGKRSLVEKQPEDMQDIKFLVTDMMWLSGWWDEYGEAMRIINPRVAASIHEHFQRGHIYAISAARRLRLPLPNQELIRYYPWGKDYQDQRQYYLNSQ